MADLAVHDQPIQVFTIAGMRMLIALEGEGPLEVTFYNGSGGVLGDGVTLHLKRGEALKVPKGHTETAVNEGGRSRAILVGLLGGESDSG